MASTITITCPECDKKLKVSSEAAGKKVRCTGCDETFVVRVPGGKSAKEAPAKAKAPAKKEAGKAAPKQTAKSSPYDDNDETPYGVTQEYLGKRCPDCANAMEEEDILCLHCGYNTRTREKAQRRRVQDQSGMDYFIWLLPGIACALGAIAFIVVDLVYILNVTVDSLGEDNWYSFFGGQFPKIYATLITIFFVYKLGWFAIKRLVFNYKPPEIELKDNEDK